MTSRARSRTSAGSGGPASWPRGRGRRAGRRSRLARRGRRRRPADLGPGPRGRPHEPRGRARDKSGRWPGASTPGGRATTRSPPTCGSGPGGRIDDLDADSSRSSGRSSAWPSGKATRSCRARPTSSRPSRCCSAHHLLAYVEMAERDRGRLGDARRRLNVSPLGAGRSRGRAIRSTGLRRRRSSGSTA